MRVEPPPRCDGGLRAVCVQALRWKLNLWRGLLERLVYGTRIGKPAMIVGLEFVACTQRCFCGFEALVVV